MRLKLLGYLVILIFATAFSLCGCSKCGCPGCGCPGSGSSGDGTVTGEQTSQCIVAATNSYLEAAVADCVAGVNSSAEILPLAGPGTCPGHFDIRPSQIEQLAECRLLVRFDFQKNLEEKLCVRLGERLHVAAVEITGGLCRPSSYAGACRQIADALVEAGCLDRAAADARLAKITTRMEDLSDWCHSQIDAAGLAGLPVIASEHQESFCLWLGLRVAAAFNGGETRPSRIDAAIADAEAGDAKLLVANLPEGRRMADMLADRLGVETVVFGNFPRSHRPAAFDELVRANVAELLKAAEKSDKHRIKTFP